MRDEDWEPMQLGATPLPGYHWIPLKSDSTGAWQAYWMKVDPGARSALHVHPSCELIQIHHGVLCDEDGARFVAGDVVVYRLGTRHFTHSEQGCVVLVIASLQATVPDAPG
jgi:anti-sigma factor ChrR (cupin superfamily)